MRTATANNLKGNPISCKALVSDKLYNRKGVIMNLISNIMTKDYEIEKKNDSKKLNQGQGFSIYKALEFSKESPQQSSQNLYFEMVYNRIV